MNQQTIHDEIDKLSQKTQNLVTATTSAAQEGLEETRKRLDTTLNRGREVYDQIRSSDMKCACAVKKAMNEHTVETVALAVGIGALVGYFSSRHCNAKSE